MVQARIEPSPAEQLRELRKARDRYAALAEQLHDSADPELDPDEKLARERNARRILRSYEKSISNSVVRMSSMDKTHRFARPSLGMRTWLVIFVAISVLEGGMLLAYFRPEIFRLLLPQKNAAKVERIARAPLAPIKAAPKPIAAPIVQPAPPETPKPLIRPQAPPPAAIAPKPAPQPAPKPITAPLPLAAAPKLVAPPQLELVAPPPVDAPPMPVVILETPPAAQSAPPVATAPVTPPPAPVTAAPQAPPPVAAAQPVSPPPVATTPAPPQQPAPRTAALTRPEAIAATHTRPPYPNEAKRLGQGGTTRMRLAISPQGAASACEIVKSAGSDQLDAAACSYVQRVWRWKAATQDGQPVAASTEVTIVWNLLTAR